MNTDSESLAGAYRVLACRKKKSFHAKDAKKKEDAKRRRKVDSHREA
jgi:hypothetical protein